MAKVLEKALETAPETVEVRVFLFGLPLNEWARVFVCPA